MWWLADEMSRNCSPGWWGWGLGGWGPGPWIFPVAWLVFLLLFWGAVVTLAVVWARRRPNRPYAAGSAKAVLAERFARGEIDAEEYRARLAVLRERA